MLRQQASPKSILANYLYINAGVS